ncbi:MAG: methyltransferase domain-containing protein [Bacteroidota bacterium]|nr:methyltransferase domain-containing protein [Bacteroidota bacterium]
MNIDLIHHTHCPSCGSDAIFPALSAKDFTVSQTVFEIWHCDECTLRFTQDVPGPSSIGAFYQSDNYVSHSDTAKGLINRLYHLVRNRTLRSKRKLIEKISGQTSGKLLDIGAGTGAFSHTMQSAGWEVTALEPDDTARQNAQKKYGLVLQDPDQLFTLNTPVFNVITLWHVLEHVHQLHPYLEQFQKCLVKDGCLVIAVPNYTSVDAKTYGEYWAAYDVPRHLYHFSPRSMERLVQSKGFATVALYPMWYDSFYVSMLSEKYKNGTGNLPGALWNGFRSNLAALRDVRRTSSVIYVFRKK